MAVKRPANLAIAVLDNELYGETGNQDTHTAHGVDLAAVARAAGFAAAETVQDAKRVEAARLRLREAAGPVFVAVKVRAEVPPLVMPPKDGGLLKNRFRRALLGTKAGS